MFSNAVIYVSLILFINLIHCKNVDQYNIGFRKSIPYDQPIFAHTLCRHGMRNIIASYKNDPWNSKDYWNGDFGELTNIGKQEQYELGQYLRERYANLLGNGDYRYNKIYVESTDEDRVLMSAAANMAGLFPPSGDQIVEADIDWQPVPIHTEPYNEDYRLALSLYDCDQYVYSLMQYLARSNRLDSFKRNQTLLRYLEQKSGQELKTPLDVNTLYDTLLVEQQQGKCLPDWAENIMAQGGTFENLALSWYEDISATPQLRKLASGFLLKEILDRFANKTQSLLSPDRSLWMYFANDFTIASMLNSLGLYKLHEPPFSSCLFFELYNGFDAPYVQVFYRNSTESDVPALNIPGCGTKCALEKMYYLYSDMLPAKDYKNECALRNGQRLPKKEITEQYNQIMNTYSTVGNSNKDKFYLY